MLLSTARKLASGHETLAWHRIKKARFSCSALNRNALMLAIHKLAGLIAAPLLRRIHFRTLEWAAEKDLTLRPRKAALLLNTISCRTPRKLTKKKAEILLSAIPYHASNHLSAKQQKQETCSERQRTGSD